jgi:hypothetical protein
MSSKIQSQTKRKQSEKNQQQMRYEDDKNDERTTKKHKTQQPQQQHSASNSSNQFTLTDAQRTKLLQSIAKKAKRLIMKTGHNRAKKPYTEV